MIETSLSKSQMLDIEDAQLRRNAAALLASRKGVFEFEPQTGVVYWDDRMRELWGISKDEEITYDGVVINGLHPDDRAHHDDRIAQALDPKGTGHFDMIYRLQAREGQPQRWVRAIGDTKFVDDVPVRLVGTVEDVTDSKEAEARSDFLLGELQHRLNNTLALVSSVLKRSRVGHENLDGFTKAVEGRIKVLSASHNILERNDWESTSFTEIAASVFADYFSGTDRLVIEPGPDIYIPEQYVLNVSLAVYELLTNSVKHGALGMETGRVHLSTSCSDGLSSIRWEEVGGSRTSPGELAATGFGSFLLRRSIAQELDAQVDYYSTGKRIIFEMRSRQLQVGAS